MMGYESSTQHRLKKGIEHLCSIELLPWDSEDKQCKTRHFDNEKKVQVKVM